ncbi:MAG TPA: DUF3379 family protein [Steroidobacteraceae bacterium]|jgi:hypothetical protein|nr:DUF3379 family protein [Steroidobacteraceae bacterium]
MQHAEFRRLIGANPKRTEPEVLEHRASCESCAKYAADMQRLDQMVRGALDVPAPPAAARPWETERRIPWLAIAASVLVLIAAGVTTWVGQRRDALIVEVVNHADRERDVLVVSDKRVAEAKVQRTLAKAGAHMTGSLPVSVARTCKIRGIVAPHLIMQTPNGAVAILLLSQEQVFTSQSFEKLGYEGEIVPVGNHSIAVVGKSKAAVESATALASSSIEWQP